MKKKIIIVAIVSVVFTMYACKENKKQEEQSSQPAPTEAATETKPATASGPKTYFITAVPDTISLGDNKEAFIKFRDLKAIELADADGIVTGMELSYKIELTNRNPIGGETVGVPTTDFRLELDNGTKVSPNSIFVSAEPDATKISNTDKFTLPAGTKPTAINLMYKQTKAIVKLQMK